MNKYRQGYGRVVSGLCKRCGRYYYYVEHDRNGTCNVCNSRRMKKRRVRNAETKTGQNIRHKGNCEDAN